MHLEWLENIQRTGSSDTWSCSWEGQFVLHLHIFDEIVVFKGLVCKTLSTESNSARNLDSHKFPEWNSEGIDSTFCDASALLTILLEDWESGTIHSSIYMYCVSPLFIFHLVKYLSHLKNVIKSRSKCCTKVQGNNEVYVRLLFELS